MRDDLQPTDRYCPPTNFRGSDGIATTIVVALLLIALAGFLRPREHAGIPKDQFWEQKLAWGHNADVVLAGDSRMYRGISPEAMRPALPQKRIVNYGFDGCGYSQEYLDSIASLLAVDNSQKLIVLGITPLSFTEKAVRENGFTEAQASQPSMHPPAWASSILAQLRPLKPREAVSLLRNYGKNYGYFQEFHADGWVASNLVPADPRIAVQAYREEFSFGGVTAEHIDRLLGFVEDMTSRGVHVYGVRPPISPDLLNLERELAHFDEANFVARFVEAGGIWIETDDSLYETYDGSHLKSSSALDFSKQVAELIARHEH